MVANGGTPGNRELNSTVFEIVEDQLQEVRQPLSMSIVTSIRHWRLWRSNCLSRNFTFVYSIF